MFDWPRRYSRLEGYFGTQHLARGVKQPEALKEMCHLLDSSNDDRAYPMAGDRTTNPTSRGLKCSSLESLH